MSPLENGVDLAAVTRVARNIDLREIRLIKVEASCSPSPPEPLEPQISVETSSALVSESLLNVICVYDFSVSAGGKQAATAQIAYLMMYTVIGEPIAEKDMEHFARANGVYHSWPFLRQFLFDLTSKMGFPPLTLPVFQVLASTRPQEEKLEGSVAEPPKKQKTQKKKTAQ